MVLTPQGLLKLLHLELTYIKQNAVMDVSKDSLCMYCDDKPIQFGIFNQFIIHDIPLWQPEINTTSVCGTIQS